MSSHYECLNILMNDLNHLQHLPQHDLENNFKGTYNGNHGYDTDTTSSSRILHKSQKYEADNHYIVHTCLTAMLWWHNSEHHGAQCLDANLTSYQIVCFTIIIVQCACFGTTTHHWVHSTAAGLQLLITGVHSTAAGL